MNTNRNRMISNVRLFAAAFIIAAAGAPVAFAEPSEKPASDAPLKGPQVKDRNVPGGKSKFGEGEKQRREGRPEPILFMAAIRGLGAEETPENVRASSDQVEKARAIFDEFREAERSYRDEHAEEFRTLREQAGMGEMRRGRGGDDAGQPGERRRPSREDRKEAKADLTPEQQAAREKLRELNEKGPKFDDYQTKVWALLSAEQQTFVKGRMEEIRKEVEAARAEGRRPNIGGMEERPRREGAPRGKRGAGKPGEKRNAPPPPPGDDEMAPPPEEN